MIEAQNVSVSICGRKIISNVDVEVRPGELSAIVGPNGSGKTTFLKALSGDVPFSGKVLINGCATASMKPWQAASVRAVLPQATSLSFPFTVREIVRLGLSGGRSGALAGEDERLPERALARVDLDGFAGRFYQELSGGEQQRVQLARVPLPGLGAGARRPAALSFPRRTCVEPRHQAPAHHHIIARDFARRGGGVVAILHDLNLTAMFAERIFVMHRGRLAAAGTERRGDFAGVRMPAEGQRASRKGCAVRAAAIGGALRLDSPPVSV